MKVLLINSPLMLEPNEEASENTIPPIGLGYLATCLKNSGIEVYLLDTIYEKYSVKSLIEYINDSKYEYIGFNVFSVNLEIVINIIESIEISTNVIIGGNVTKFIYHELINIKQKNNIIIIIGEAEKILVDIIQNSIQEKPIEEKENRKVYLIDKNSVYFPQSINGLVIDRSFLKTNH